MMCLVFEHQRRLWGGEKYYVNGFFYPTAQVPWYKLPFNWGSSHVSIGDFAWLEVGREWRYSFPFKCGQTRRGLEIYWGKKEGWGFDLTIFNRKTRRELKDAEMAETKALV